MPEAKRDGSLEDAAFSGARHQGAKRNSRKRCVANCLVLARASMLACFVFVSATPTPGLADGVDDVVADSDMRVGPNPAAKAIVNRGIIATSNGNDRVQGDAIADGVQSAEAAGILNEAVAAGGIRTGAGDDKVSGSGNAQTDTGPALAFGITNINRRNPSKDVATIDTAGGTDVIDGRAVANGQGDVGAFGLLTGEVLTRGGGDQIIGTATSTGETTTEARGVSVGVSDVDDDTVSGGGEDPPLIPPEVGNMETGRGADIVNGSASVTVNGQHRGEIFFAGANGIVVDGPTEEQVFRLFGNLPKEVDPSMLTTSTLDTGIGNDKLIANVILNVSQVGANADEDLEVIGDGIENAGTVWLGAGNDSVTSTVSVTSTISRAKALADALDNSSVGIITGLDLEVNDATRFDMGPGNDSFTSNIFASAIDDLAAADGMDNRGVFVAGAGDDSFNLTSRSVHARVLNVDSDVLDGEQPEAIADGWENRNKVFLDDPDDPSAAGNDSVIASATAFGNGVLTIAEGIESREFFDAGGGNDFFDLTALAISNAFGDEELNELDPDNITQAAGFQTEQITEGDLFLGAGNDTILVGSRDAEGTVVNHGATAVSKGENLGTFAFGITQATADAFNPADDGLIDTGAGNDTLDGIAKSTGANDVDAFGLLFTNAKTRAGADDLKGHATALLDENPPFLGIARSADKSTADAIGIGVGVTGNDRLPDEAGTLETGSGKDTIEGVADAQIVDGNGQASAFGIFVADESVLNTQGGADFITAEATAAGNKDVKAFDIFGGGTIKTGGGADEIVTDVDTTIVDVNSFGGGIKIETGNGDDYVFGFGHADLNGGGGANDELAFGFSRSAFDREGGKVARDCGANQVEFTVKGVVLTAVNFERFTFHDGVPFLPCGGL